MGASQNIQVDPPYFLGGLSEEVKENVRLQDNIEVRVAISPLNVWTGRGMSLESESIRGN